ncbi:hypothetical protein KCU73_g2326, partial [Aureobasidium melanogenum]
MFSAPENSHRSKVLKWLSPLHPRGDHEQVRGKAAISKQSNNRHSGYTAGRWLLDSDVFDQWRSGELRKLWYIGMPGAGKSVLAYEHLIGSVVKQIICEDPLPRPLEELWKHCDNGEHHPSEDELTALLLEVTKNELTYIVIDALDECAIQFRNRFLEALGVHDSHVKFLVTSRYLEVFEDVSRDFTRMEIAANYDDLDLFIDYKIRTEYLLKRRLEHDDHLRRAVKYQVRDKCNGMFLLASMHMRSLATALTKGEFKELLSKLPTQVNDAYMLTLTRIEGMESNKRKLALDSLYWIIYARRQLTIQDLQYALAIDPGNGLFDKDRIPEPEDLRDLCNGLVTIVDNKVGLVHYTAQSFLNDHLKNKVPDFDAVMAQTCINYLSASALMPNGAVEGNLYGAVGPVGRGQPSDMPGQQIPRSSNTAKSFNTQMRPMPDRVPPRNANRNGALQDYHMQLMLLEQQNKKRLLMARQDSDNMTNTSDIPVPAPSQPRTFYTSALERNDLYKSTFLLYIGEHLDHHLQQVSETHGLFHAIFESLKDLLTDCRKRDYLRRLLIATRGSVEDSDILESLSEFYPDDTSDEDSDSEEDEDSRQSFSTDHRRRRSYDAFDEDQEDEDSQLSLDEDEDGESLPSSDEEGDLPQLVDEGINREKDRSSFLNESQEKEDSSPLPDKDEDNDEDGDQDQEQDEEEGPPPFSTSVSGDAEIFASSRHQTTEDDDSSISSHSTGPEYSALHLATFLGPNVRDDSGQTPWSQHAYPEFRQVLEILVKGGANPNKRGFDGVSALYLAAAGGHLADVNFSLERGVDASVRTNFGWTPLHWAASNGHFHCVQALLAAGAEPSPVSDQSVTPLDMVKGRPGLSTIEEILRVAGAKTIREILDKKTSRTRSDSS